MSEIMDLMDRIIELKSLYGYNYLDIIYNHNSRVTIDLNSESEAVYCHSDNDNWLYVKKDNLLKLIRFNGVDDVKLYA